MEAKLEYRKEQMDDEQIRTFEKAAVTGLLESNLCQHQVLAGLDFMKLQRAPLLTKGPSPQHSESLMIHNFQLHKSGQG